MLAVIISCLYMLTRRMNFRIILFIKREILDSFHNIALPEMNHSFDVINQPLMLYLCRLVYSLLDFNRVLIDFRTQLSSHLNLYVSLCDIILQNQEHCFIRLKQYAVLVHVHVLWRHRMLPDI
jgi:hypothetical protein